MYQVIEEIKERGKNVYRYVYGDNHIKLAYHDQTAEYQGKKNDVALIANFVGALGWREYLRFKEMEK